MVNKFLSFVLFSLVFAFPALAQQSNLVVRSYIVSVGSTASQCVPASSAMVALYIENVGGTNNIYYDYSPNVATTGASLLSATGNGNKWWPTGNAPRTGLSCITSSSTSNLFIAIYSTQ